MPKEQPKTCISCAFCHRIQPTDGYQFQCLNKAFADDAFQVLIEPASPVCDYYVPKNARKQQTKTCTQQQLTMELTTAQ